MFNKSNFCHIASNNRNEQKGSVFIYKTSDSLAQVTESGYFNEKLIDINLHDLIIHVQYNPVNRTLNKSVLIVTERTLDNVETAPIIDQTIDDDIDQLGDQVQGIEEKIPGAASAQNQLADKLYVDTNIENLQDGIENLQNTKADKDYVDGQLATKQPAGDYATNSALTSGLALKVAIAQGSENAGKILKIDDNGNVIVADETVGASLPILYHTWSDHLLNDISWLRADTFSWQSGDVYKAAYEHLASELHIENLYAWQEEESRNVYTKSATPSVGDSVYRTGGGLYGTVQSVGADNITVNGMNFPRNSGGDILGTNAETDTVDNITITFYRAEDGHKICLPDQESNISALYAATGVAWYYILDTVNKQFKLPRSKHNKYASTLNVVGNGKTLGLTDGVSTFGIAGTNNALNAAGSYIARSGNDILLNVGEQIAGWTGATANGKTIGVTTDPEKSGLIAQQVQDTDQYKYLYFYVGNFEQSAIEQTAGINAELFNGKVDVDLSNMNASQSAKDTIVGWGIPDYSAGVDITWTNETKNITIPSGTVLPSQAYYIAPADGMVVIYAVVSNGAEHVLVNENVVENPGTNVYVNASFPVSKGDEIRVVIVSRYYNCQFFPFKGVN